MDDMRMQEAKRHREIVSAIEAMHKQTVEQLRFITYYLFIISIVISFALIFSV